MICINYFLNIFFSNLPVKLVGPGIFLGETLSTDITLLLIIGLFSFLFLHEYLDRLCVLRNLFISSQLSNSLAYNCSLYIFFSDFSYLSLLPVLLGSLAKSFSILLNFSTNQLSFIDFFSILYLINFCYNLYFLLSVSFKFSLFFFWFIELKVSLLI